MMGIGYNLEPIVAGAVPAARAPRHPVQRRPARRRDRPVDRVPGADGPRGDLGPRARGAGRRGDRRGDPRPGRQPLRRRLHQPAPAPGLGPGPGDVRRGARRCSARWASALARGAQQHVMACVKHYACNSMENARFTRRRAGRRARAARGLPAALPGRRGRRRRRGDERVQLGQRRVVRAEPHAAHRDPAGRVGLRRLRHVRLHLGSARPGRAPCAAGLDLEMPFAQQRARTLPAALGSGQRRTGTTSSGPRRRIVATQLRFAAGLRHARAGPGRGRLRAEHRALAREVAAPVDGAAAQRAGRRPAAAAAGRGRRWAGSRWSAGWPTCRTPATTARPTSAPPRWSRRWPGCAPRCPGSRSCTVGRRRARRRCGRGRRRRLHRRGRGRVRRLVRRRAGRPLPARGRPGGARRAGPGLGGRTAGRRRRPRLAAAARRGRGS